MKIGRLNRASFAKIARRAMLLFAFAALGAQAAAGTVSVSYELNGEKVSFSGATLREVNEKMRTHWEVSGDGCAYNAEKLPADGTGTLTWEVSGTVEQGEYLKEGALVLPSLSGGYIYRDGTYRWKKLEVKAAESGATIVSIPTFDVHHSYLSTGTDTTTVTGVTLQGGLYVVPHGTVTFDSCTFTGQLRVPNGDGAFAVTGCTFTGATAAPDSSGYVMHYQAAGTLAFTGNTVADGYKRGLNIDNKDLTATVEKKKLGTTTDAGRSAIQISTCVKLAVTENEIKLDGGNAITLHKNLLTRSAAPEVSISGNTVTGTGYLVYDDAMASGTAFTSDSLKLTYATDNEVAATVNTTKGVKDKTEYALSGTVATTLHSVDPRMLGYATSGKAEALPATPDMNGEVVNVTAAQAQYVLDGAYGPIDGKTINFTESINDTLILGRASKYDGSKTVYRHGSHGGEALSYAAFIAYKNQSGWTESCYYERTVENVTFTAKTDINTSESTTVYDGFTFKNCTFDLGTTADGNQAIRYYNENDNGNVKNLVVEGCTFKTCSQGVYTVHVKNVTVKGCTFDTTGHNAIAIQDFKGTCDHGAVVIMGNTFKNIGDRIIRFNKVGMGTTVTITGNTADGNSGKLDEATGKREIVKATTLPVNAADSITASGNIWGENTVVEGVFIDDYATKLGTEACPYSREQFAAMTRAEYRAAQARLGGTLYVNVGDYAYETDGVLGNGVRNDTPGQVPDHSKLNAYGENGYLGGENDGANGHAVVFVGGTITSGATGYTDIDSIGTSLLFAVPAYTKVTFKETMFKNVLSFDYQLYTSPWSQLGGLTFNGCTFDGIIVGAIAAQELAFNGCTFNNYVNTTSANNSNPTWIRPAYGNWTKGDNEGQGTGFRSLTKITFENNTVTSTRPVKFERIAQWEMATTVTATNNTFDITPQAGDTSTKNVGLYFGANAKFDLVIENNEKSEETAALYTAVYKAPNAGTYVGLPAGSTVKNAAGEAVATDDALAWKTNTQITLQTTEEITHEVAITLGGAEKAMPFSGTWLAANIGANASSWTTAALQQTAANGLAKWQCCLFGLDPKKDDAKVVATVRQGTDEGIPLAVANADASASPLVTGGYVTVAYVLMGSNNGTAWTQVATSNTRDGLAIPLTGTTYKFYRVDVTVTSAKGN